ncbi:MAG: hypothetical protein RR620_10440 [Clostridium sp.]
MAELKDATTHEIVQELKKRLEIRDVIVARGEAHKINISGGNDSKSRYIKGLGPVMILEVKM